MQSRPKNRQRYLHSKICSCVIAAAIFSPAIAITPLFLRVMPVGDSITEGFTLPNAGGTASYRQQLENKLTAANCAFEMVGGKLDTNPPTAYQSFHEGYSARWAKHFISGTNGAPAIADIAVTYSPQIILLHVGSNDIRQGQTTDQTLASIRDVVVKINTVNPDIVVLLANVIPWFGANNGNNPAPFEGNNGIEGEIALLGSKITAAVQNGFPMDSGGSIDFPNVHLVEVAEGFTRSMMQPDLIHPNAEGEEFIAQRFFETIDTLNLCTSNFPDIIAPETTLTAPTTTAPFVGPKPVFYGNASDTGGAGINHIRIAIGDNNSANSNGILTRWYNFNTNTFGRYTETQIATPQNPARDAYDWSISIPPLVEGSGDYQFFALAVDNAGNQAYDEGQGVWPTNIRFFVDDTAPVAQAISPADQSSTNAATLDITGISSDLESGTNRVRVRVQRLGVSPIQFWNGSAWTTTSAFPDARLDSDGSAWTLPNVDITEPGRYRVRVSAIDNAGNATRAFDNPKTDFSVGTPDTTSPSAQATSPGPSESIAPAITTVSGISRDRDSGVKRVRVRVQRLGDSPIQFWNGSAWTPTSAFPDAELNTDGTWTLSNVDLTEPGRYRVRVNTIDNAGNAARAFDNPKTDFSVE